MLFKKLDLSNSNLNSSALANLFDILCDHQYIVSLNIANQKISNKNKICEESALKLRQCLVSNKILISLNMSGIGFTEKVFQLICEGLSHNNTLKYLDFSKNGIGYWGGDNLSHACTHSFLENLNISCNYLGDQGIREFARCLESQQVIKHMKSLNIGYNCFGGLGFGNLSDRLSRNFNLQELILEGNGLGGKKMITLKSFLPNSSIQHLNLQSCELDDESIEMIKHGLKKNQSLQKLDLRKNFIYSKGVKVLSDGLFGHPSITNLNLSFNRIGDQCVDALIQLLGNENKIEIMDISSNLLSEQTANKMLHVLRENQHLKSLNLKNNSFNFQQAMKIEEMVQKRYKSYQSTKMDWVINEIDRLNELISKKSTFVEELQNKKQILILETEKLKVFLEKNAQNKQQDKKELADLEAVLGELMIQGKDIGNCIFNLEEKKSE